MLSDRPPMSSERPICGKRLRSFEASTCRYTAPERAKIPNAPKIRFTSLCIRLLRGLNALTARSLTLLAVDRNPTSVPNQSARAQCPAPQLPDGADVSTGEKRERGFGYAPSDGCTRASPRIHGHRGRVLREQLFIGRGFLLCASDGACRGYARSAPGNPRARSGVAHSRSSGLRTTSAPRFSTCKYTIVVLTSAWPSSSCTVRMS